MTTTAPLLAATAALLIPLSLAPGAQPPTPPAAAEPPTAAVPPAPPLDPALPPPPTAEEPPLVDRVYITLRGLGEATFRTDLDDSPGDYAVYRFGTGIGIDGPLAERLRFGVNLDSEFSFYDFRNATGLVPGTDDPMSEAYRLVLRPQIIVLQSERLSWFVAGVVESAGEYDADFGKTITGGGYGGVRYRFSENFAASFGLGVTTRLEENALLLPLVALEWRLNRKVSLATDGLGLSLAAQLSDAWWFTASGGWELREFRLDRDGPLPSGVLRDERVPIGVGFAWRPSRGVSVDLLGGAVVWQRFTVDDRDGDRVSRVNSDPTGFVRLAARITF